MMSRSHHIPLARAACHATGLTRMGALTSGGRALVAWQAVLDEGRQQW